MKLTDIALREPRFTLLISLFLFIGGIIAFWQLPRSEDPPIVFRYSLIVTKYLGASAQRVESLVTRKIEEAVREVPEVETLHCISRKNASIVLVKIQDRYKDIRPIWNRLRRKIDRVKDDLPDGVDEPFLNDEYGEVFGTIVTVSGKSSYAKLRKAAETVHDELLRIDDVSKVVTLGDRSESVMVKFFDSDMADAGISPYHLIKYLEAQNVIAPGGSIREGNSRYAVELAGELSSIEDIENLEVSLPDDDESYYLGDLVEVKRQTQDPPDSIMKSSGTQSLGLAVSMRNGGNIEKMGREVKSLLNKLKDKVPAGVELDLIAFEPERVSNRVNAFFGNLVQSLIIVMFILMITLGLRTGSIVASMMPLTFLTALVIMLGLGININLVALAGFILVFGIIVDTHIVISERILTLRERGEAPVSAAESSTYELHGPLITAALTTLSGFLPIYLAKSSAGEYVSPLFTIVAITLLSSTFFAFTLTPLLSVSLFKVKTHKEKNLLDHSGYRLYHRLLLWMLPRPFIILFLTLLLFLGSLYCFRFIPKIFFPPSDRPIFTLEIEFPAGTVIEHTEKTVDAVDAYVEANLRADKNGGDGITNWATFVGRNAPRFILNHRTVEYNPEYAYFLFNLTSVKIIPEMIQSIESYCSENFPGAQIRARPLESGPSVGYPIKARVSGEDIDGIFRIVNEVKNKLRSIDGTHNIHDDWGPPVKKYRVVIDETKASLASITHADVAISLQALLTGYPATTMREGNIIVPINVHATVDSDNEIEKIETLNIHSIIKRGTTVLLKDIAEIQEVRETASFVRRNFQRTVTVRADIQEGVSPKAVDTQLKQWIEEKNNNWGDDYSVMISGESEESSKANQSIISKLPWTAFLIVLLLIRQTRSFRRTFIIVCAVPMGLIGVVVGLLVTQQPFGFMTLVGVVSLTGIVVNNAIILIDRIRINLDIKGLSSQESIIEASLNRLRPILLTTVTTIGGILPLYFRGNPTFQPMSVAIIFGLIFATLLVLGIVPLLYSVLFRVDFRDYPNSH